jgi:hypothetical protein
LLRSFSKLKNSSRQTHQLRLMAALLIQQRKEIIMDIVSFGLFFFVVVPLGFIYLSRKRKLDEQVLASQKETIRLLAELLDELKKSSTGK